MISRIASTTCLVALLGAFGGCAVDTAPTPETPAVLELGSGSWRFEPLEEGQAVSMVRGAQGGWHVWLSFRASGMESDRATLEIESQVADASRPPQHTVVDVRLERPDVEGRRNYIGWPEVLADPGCLIGDTLRIEATLTDEAGVQVATQRAITLMGGDDPPTVCP